MKLIDEFLPSFDFREQHALSMRASAGVILDCVTWQRAQDDPIVRFAIRLRELPSRLISRSLPRPFDFDDFMFLGRNGDRSVVFGLAGAFLGTGLWLARDSVYRGVKTNDRMDVCRLVTDFAVEAMPSAAMMLSTKTRVQRPTDDVRRRFAPYWYVIRPVSRLIRRRMLGRIREQAEGLAGAR
jgi:hypothetical protein